MITNKSLNVKTIRPGDEEFIFTDGLVVYRRAFLEIKDHCPAYYQEVIESAVTNGWLEPVMQMSEKEYVLMGLAK